MSASLENCLLCSGDVGGHPGVYINSDGVQWPCAACKGTGKVKSVTNWGNPIPALKIDFGIKHSPKFFDFDTLFAVIAVVGVLGCISVIAIGLMGGIKWH